MQPTDPAGNAARGVIAGLPGVARSTAEVHVLLLALALLYCVVTGTAAGKVAWWALAMTVYGGVAAGLRRINEPEAAFRRLSGEVLAMAVFVSTLLVLAPGGASTLVHLYLLPVMIAALLLGRAATLLLIGLIVAARIAAGDATDWDSLHSAANLLTEFFPMLLVAFLTSALARDLDTATGALRLASEREDLTGLYNLRAFSRLCQAELDRLTGRGIPAAVLLIDVDDLRAINGRYGHEAGDRALQAVAGAIRRAVRKVDVAARYGGDEFLVLLPGADREAAEIIANRVRHHVFATTQDFDYAMRRLSVNVGIALSPQDGRDIRRLIQSSDVDLRRDVMAKHARQHAPAATATAWTPQQPAPGPRR
jgi:diguanylate cyclase (GGDEF)-like protein